MATLLDAREWPYPVAYGKENEVEADVLILGGGVAGCHAAITAAKRGAKVVVVEKGATIRSGGGGAGVDHWHGACTNPCCTVTSDEMIELALYGDYRLNWEFGNGISSYILFNESYDALMDVESWGVKVRDSDDEFVGAEFRDEETKLMFAYDYDACHCIRVNGGTDIKVAMYKEMKRQGVNIYDRVMATSLLTEGGRVGGRVAGATGLHSRTGEFYIFRAKATILATATPTGMWTYSMELSGSAHGDINNSGEGTAMAWLAGAELTLMEKVAPMPHSGGFAYPHYGTGNAHNTWYACTMVDANGKEIPWVDRDGKVLETVSQRYHHAPGQKAMFNGPNLPPDIRTPSLVPDLPERIRKGEYVLPLYADLPGMPALERRAIWGLMIPHEGKCKIIYDTYQAAGFDPDKDLLQTNVMPPDKYIFYPYWNTMGPRQWREGPGGGGLLFDWDLRTNLEGLYVAGTAVYSGSNHAGSASTGRYAARKATAYVASVDRAPKVSRAQVEREKERVYAPVRRVDGIGWKELRAGLTRIMQDYLGEYSNQETLDMGLSWLASIRESEATNVYARNPHELMRAVECLGRITTGEIMMRATLNRKSSSRALGVSRLDYPEDSPEWKKLITMRLEDGDVGAAPGAGRHDGQGVKVGELPVDYYLQAPNAPSFADNYREHCGL
jgi:succinate dehydrogenase/fumarate reductase flavoprotein subunit